MYKYKLKFTRLQNELLRLLCIKAGERLNQRQIAKLLDSTPTGIAKALKGIDFAEIEKSRTMNLNLVSLRRDQETLIKKRIENQKLVYESGLVDYLSEQYPGSTIILFGSYSRGEDTHDSDIDIAIIGSKEKDISLRVFEDCLERVININYYGSMAGIKKELRENLCNGIVLSGAIEL